MAKKRKEYLDKDNIFIHFSISFIGLIKYTGVKDDYSKKEQQENELYYYSFDDPIFEIVEIYHLDTSGASFYKDYKPGSLWFFDSQDIYTLKNKKNSFKQVIDSLFNYGNYGMIK